QLAGADVAAAAPGDVVVDRAVAVVVGVVAGLGRRTDVGAAARAPAPGGAGLRAHPARADVGAAAPADAVVDGAVAVVVHVVADLDGGRHLADAAAPHPDRAEADAGLARADARAADHGEPVVHHAVAIVVDVVAALDRRPDLADAR